MAVDGVLPAASTDHSLPLQWSRPKPGSRCKQSNTMQKNEGGAELPVLVAVAAVSGALAVVAVPIPAAAEVGERASGLSGGCQHQPLS